MATWIKGGRRVWGGQIDDDGHRTWTAEVLTVGDANDGPANHSQTPGLPIEGDIWLIDGDQDIWAWFRSGRSIQQMSPEKTGQGSSGEGLSFFLHTFTASTRPADAGTPSGGGGKDDRGSRKKCADQRIEDPLSEPPAVSTSTIRYQREEQFGFIFTKPNGDPLDPPDTSKATPFRYTSGERIAGIEFDRHRRQVTIEYNTLDYEGTLLDRFLELLNDAPLWDMPARCWKLCDWSAQRKLYGTCGFYHTKRLVIESNAIPVTENDGIWSHPVLSAWKVQGPDGRWWLPAWDRYVLDESRYVLNGKWKNDAWQLVPVPGYTPPGGDTNPNWKEEGHYITAVDRKGQPTRLVLSRTVRGAPATKGPVGDEFNDHNWLRLQRYNVGNMFEIGLPVSID